MEQKSEISAARYRQIRDFAGRVLLKHTEGLLPVQPLSVIRHSAICSVATFENYEKDVLSKTGIRAIDYFGNQEACTQRKPDRNQYIVFYDGSLALKNFWRLHWTLAHEIGHIVLGHLQHAGTSVCSNDITEEEHGLFEREADYFAGMLLAYPSIMKACNVRSAHDIKRMCYISTAAAESRYRSIQSSQQKPSKIDALVEVHFSRVIERANLPYRPEPDWNLFPW